MAKLNEKEKINSMNPEDSFVVVTGDQDIKKLPYNNFPIAKQTQRGLINRSQTFLYDYYTTVGIVYRALTFTTDIYPQEYMSCYLDIKDIISWNYSGWLKVSIKVAIHNYKLVRINIVDNTTPGLIESIYCYFNSQDKLCFTLNFKGTLNISGGVILANCSYYYRSGYPNFSNSIVTQQETEKYVSGTYSNQVGFLL